MNTEHTELLKATISSRIDVLTAQSKQIDSLLTKVSTNDYKFSLLSSQSLIEVEIGELLRQLRDNH